MPLRKTLVALAFKGFRLFIFIKESEVHWMKFSTWDINLKVRLFGKHYSIFLLDGLPLSNDLLFGKYWARTDEPSANYLASVGSLHSFAWRLFCR